jgi:protein SCO1/2
MSKKQITIIGMLGALIIVLIGATLWTMTTELSRDETTLYNKPVTTIGGDFTLINQNGETVTQASYADKPKVMFFGFTFCPDVCPTSMFELAEWMNQLGPAADNLHYIFVTVDPERDTPEVLKEYIGSFSDNIQGLTGTPEQVEAAVKAYRVFARQVALDRGGYTMDHTASLFLMNKENQLVGTIAYGEDSETAVAKLRRLAGANS